jgi:hypothetical protein
MTCSFLKPERARSLRSSQPSPPAPTTKTSTRLPSRSRSCARGSTNETNHLSLGVKKRQKATEERRDRGQATHAGAGIEGGLHEVPGAGEEHVEVTPPLGLRRRRLFRVRGGHRGGALGLARLLSSSGEKE